MSHDKSIMTSYSFAAGAHISNVDYLTVIQASSTPPTAVLFVRGVNTLMSEPLFQVDDDNDATIFEIYALKSSTPAIRAYGQALFYSESDAVQTIAKATSGQTADISQWQNSAGGVIARVADDGLVMGFGLAASGLRVQDVGDATALSDAVNLDQLNNALSGHLDYWELKVGRAYTSSITNAILLADSLSTSIVPMPVGRQCRVVMIGVATYHENVSDPGSWDCQVKRDDDTVIATFQFGMASSAGTVRFCASGVTASTDFVPGDGITVVASGATVTNPIFRIFLGMRATGDIV